mgnify:CR=1 FL=1|tara:strand:+ start:9475 stop:9753 length:279 start_codon:yes stop_codon:yes gene_type:complete
MEIWSRLKWGNRLKFWLVRHARKTARRGTDHTCYLLYPDEDVSFKMSVSQGDECIRVSPVTANGVDAQFLSKEARELIEMWAKEEALRVCFN